MSTILIGVSGQGYLRRVEAAGYDLLFRLRGFSSFNPSILIIQITDEDLGAVGRWPWDRTWHATMAMALKDMGARSVYFDIIFSEPSREPESDMAFAEAIERAGNVYLPFAYQERSVNRETALWPVPELAENLKGTGSINVYPDIDGVIRTMPLFFREANEVYPHIALQIAMDYGNFDITGISPERIILTSPEKKVKAPLVDGNSTRINWLGKWKDTFTHFSYVEVIANYRKLLSGEPLDIDIRPIKDSICLVAVTAIGLYDIRPTPLEAEYPGVGAIATVISTLLDGKMLSVAGPFTNYALVYFLGTLPFFFISGKKSLREILAVALIAVLFFFVTVKLFENHYLINYVLALGALLASYTVVATYHFVRVSVERQKFFQMAVTDSLTGIANVRYFMMILNTEYLLAKREPEGRGFCVVMLDIDHFKKFNDTYGHAVGDYVLKGVADVLKNSVRSSDIVARYGGEEMVVLLRVTDIRNAMRVAEKIRGNIERFDFRDEKNHYKVTVSAGVSQYRGGEEDTVETIMKRADAGLYEAKENGRNRVETLEKL